jgi:hypothetical protein
MMQVYYYILKSIIRWNPGYIVDPFGRILFEGEIASHGKYSTEMGQASVPAPIEYGC